MRLPALDNLARIDQLKIEPRNAREVMRLLALAKTRLGWTPKTSFADLVAEMVREDLKAAERDELVKRYGFKADGLS